MAKRRKTLKQKRQSDLRVHEALVDSPLSSQIQTLPAAKTTFTFEKPQAQRLSYITSLQNHSFLRVDLKKTLIVTVGIILAQLLLFYAMNIAGK
ncbi:MAG TPA: hypothetical protein VJC10_04000 [Patescibacteria group bacterium]|nr:hypothetical protein [Patescibacteria group bacterium]